MSRKRLHRHLADFDFSWNARKIDDGARTARTVQSALGKRLAYPNRSAGKRTKRKARNTLRPKPETFKNEGDR
jgi:hypothetical protein